MSSINKRPEKEWNFQEYVDRLIALDPIHINKMFIELTNQISRLRERIAELEKRPTPTRHVHWLDMSR